MKQLSNLHTPNNRPRTTTQHNTKQNKAKPSINRTKENQNSDKRVEEKEIIKLYTKRPKQPPGQRRQIKSNQQSTTGV